MFSKLTALEKTLILSIGFTISFLVARLFFIDTKTYFFYPWNLLLAAIPCLFSRALQRTKPGYKSVLLVMGWLLFFPNAPYLITDVFHFQHRSPVPLWFDLVLVVSGAWNGLVLGIVSLLQVERFLANHLKPVKVKILCAGFALLCGYGVYVGRYWRFNSWDIVAQPKALMKASAGSFIHPHHNVQLWAFTVAFAGLFYLIYQTMKQMLLLGSELMLKKELEADVW